MLVNVVFTRLYWHDDSRWPAYQLLCPCVHIELHGITLMHNGCLYDDVTAGYDFRIRRYCNSNLVSCRTVSTWQTLANCSHGLHSQRPTQGFANPWYPQLD